jgi:hypothetical protein
MVLADVAVRCAAHPSRPAVDACPVCGRPRCGADQLSAPGGGCTVCQGLDQRPARSRRRPAGERELLVRAALAADAAAISWGYVTAEYVGAGLFGYLSPAVLGVLCGAAATAAAGSPRSGQLLRRVRLVAVLLALLGAGLGFVLEGTYGVLSASPDVLLPYVISGAAAWLWTAPPRSAPPS